MASKHQNTETRYIRVINDKVYFISYIKIKFHYFFHKKGETSAASEHAYFRDRKLIYKIYKFSSYIIFNKYTANIGVLNSDTWVSEKLIHTLKCLNVTFRCLKLRHIIALL